MLQFVQLMICAAFFAGLDDMQPIDAAGLG